VRPLLLLDVDGVVNVPGCRDGEMHEIELEEIVVVVSFPKGIRRRLALLDERYEIAWLSSWGRFARERLGPLLGFGWPSAWDPVLGETQESKVRVVRQHAGEERAFAWVDDLRFPDADLWLAQRTGPSFLPLVEPTIGLDDGLARDLLEWAESIR
jgi:hypothetical protein